MSSNVLTIDKAQFIFVNSMRRGWTITLGSLRSTMVRCWWQWMKMSFFSRFERPEYEGPVVVVFLPMLEHPSATWSFNLKNQLTKPKNRTSNLEIEALIKENHQITRI